MLKSGWTGQRKGLLTEPLNCLMFTQFLSAFADNVIFFVILGIIGMRGIEDPESYMAVVQIAFLLAYVVLAPLVGAFADKNAKSRVLLVGNLVKFLGMVLLYIGLHPALCYAVVGIGAVIYSPAKYGILTELTHTDEDLLKANAKIEGYTILAILAGTVAGGALAKLSVTLGLIVCILLYLSSLAATLWIPRMQGNPRIRYGESARDFLRELRLLFRHPTACFSLVGTGAFWMTAAVLRIAILAWLPVYLQITDKMQQSIVVGVTGVGIIIGAALTPKLIPPGKFYWSAYYGLGMVVLIGLTAYVAYLPLTLLFLLLVGLFGGIFIIPMNTSLQDTGKTLVGSGKTIAIQNFVENSMNIIGLMVFKMLIFIKLPLDVTISLIGLILLGFVFYLFVKIKTVRF